eukprot:sb/3471602/
MSHLSTIELEEFYNNKKPTPVEAPTSPVGPTDSRSGSAILSAIFPADLDDVWWSGNVEVKGLPKNGTKWIKFYMSCTGVKLCFFPAFGIVTKPFAGKKKQLKAQILLGSSSTVSEDTEDKKKSIYIIKDISYPDVSDGSESVRAVTMVFQATSPLLHPFFTLPLHPSTLPLTLTTKRNQFT